MKYRTLAIAGLILAAAVTRLLPHPENFAPITAMAVFGAIRFRNRAAAVFAPLAALLITDLIKELLWRSGLERDQGLYLGMAVVYGTTALVALMARLAHGTRSPAIITAVTVAGSCLFFLVTNFDVWVEQTAAPTIMYPLTFAGLMECYAAGIPFFLKGTLPGDLIYTGILFGGWALVELHFPALRSAPSTT
jgi:hypothetical protein